MKKLLLLIMILAGYVAQAQNPYYIGSPYLKWSGRMLLQDSSRNGTYDTLASRKWVRFYVSQTAGSGNTNSNIGSGFRWAVPNTNNVKTFFGGYGTTLDSSSNANALTIKIDTAAGGISTRAWRQKGIDSLGALIVTPTFQQTLTSGSAITGNNDVTGAFRMGFGTSGSRISAFNAYASGNININATGINTLQATSLLYATSPNLLLEGTTTFQMTGGAITGVQFNPATYSQVLIDASGNIKKTSAGLSVSLTDAATISTDASLGLTTGASYVVTLGGNRTIANPTNLVDGQIIRYVLIQDGTGNRTVTWGANFRFSTDTPAPTLSTGAGAVDIIGFVYRSTGSILYVTGMNLGH